MRTSVSRSGRSTVAQNRAEDLEHQIVERKEAEAAVRGERDRAQRYLDAPEVILLALDLEGRITLANRYACSILGWTAEELLGRDWIETCLPLRLRGALRKNFRDLIGGDLSVVENPVLTRSGEERLIEWRNTVQRDDAGQVIGTFSSGADITERSQAVEALRAAEERMRFALQSANVGIWDMDYATGVLRWSETLEAQYGLQPGTFGGTFDAFQAAYSSRRSGVGHRDGWQGDAVRDRFHDTEPSDLARRHGAVAERRGPHLPRRPRRAGARRRDLPGCHRTPRPGSAVSAGAEDGSHRPAGRRRGPRLQQPADRHSGQLRAAPGRSRLRRAVQGRPGRRFRRRARAPPH